MTDTKEAKTEAKTGTSSATEATSKSGKSGSGLEPNVAAMLAWIFAPITSIIFLMTDKDDEFVRFHSMQSLIWSIVGFIGATVLAIILTFTIIFACCAWVPYLYYFVNIYGAIKAYNNEMWELPVIGEMSKKKK